MNSSFNQRNLAFTVVLFICFLNSGYTTAQQLMGKYVKLSLGIASSYPYDESEDIYGSGFYASGEYIHVVTEWFSIRPYANIFITGTNNSSDFTEDYEATSKAFMLGGKARLFAPIPYVGPFIELGFGASIGSFRTFTPLTNIEKQGVVMHIPFTLGLALGKNHNFEIAMMYYDNYPMEQGNTAFALSYTIKIGKKELKGSLY